MNLFPSRKGTMLRSKRSLIGAMALGGMLVLPATSLAAIIGLEATIDGAQAGTGSAGPGSAISRAS